MRIGEVKTDIYNVPHTLHFSPSDNYHKLTCTEQNLTQFSNASCLMHMHSLSPFYKKGGVFLHLLLDLCF